MKSFEEYSKSVFEKRDRIIRQRRKRAKAAAVSLCAVVAVSLSAFAIGNQFGIIESESSNGHAESAQIPTDKYHFLADEAENKKAGDCDACPPAEEFQDEEFFTKAAEAFDANSEVTEIAPEICVTNSSLNESGQKPDIATEPYYIDSGCVSQPQDDSEDGLKDRLDKKYTDEEIIDAAFNALDAEKRAKAEKSDAEIMVEHKSTGENSYIVMFKTSDGGYVKAKLDADTLEIAE